VTSRKCGQLGWSTPARSPRQSGASDGQFTPWRAASRRAVRAPSDRHDSRAAGRPPPRMPRAAQPSARETAFRHLARHLGVTSMHLNRVTLPEVPQASRHAGSLIRQGGRAKRFRVAKQRTSHDGVFTRRLDRPIDKRRQSRPASSGRGRRQRHRYAPAGHARATMRVRARLFDG
jgi:hypothetical protein